MIKDKVLVLMSTYNGEKYVNEQLESILNQSIRDVDILIRDDGSRDKTIQIISKWMDKFPERIKLEAKENKGVVESFFELVKLASLDYDYYFFSDQDDYWDKKKIEKAIERIKSFNKNKNIGYCSNLNLVDKNLKFMGKKYTKELIPSLRNCFIENIVTGCTYGANRTLFVKLKEDIRKIGNNIKKIPMHDYHFYFLTTLYGKLVYDENSYIGYRQHGNNVVGMEKNKIKFTIQRIKRVFKRKSNDKRIEYLRFIKQNYQNELPILEKNFLLNLLENYNCIFKRLSFILKNEFVRQSKIESYLSKITYLLKKF